MLTYFAENQQSDSNDFGIFFFSPDTYAGIIQIGDSQMSWFSFAILVAWASVCRRVRACASLSFHGAEKMRIKRKREDGGDGLGIRF